MAAHCAGGINGEAILTATALLRTAATVVRLAVGVATHEAQHPTARAARLVGHWFARREDRLGAAQPWPRISGLRNREGGRYEQTRQDCHHHDFPEHHRRNHFRISIFRTTKNANLFHSASGSPGESLIVEPNFEPDFESRYPLRGAILAGDRDDALDDRFQARILGRENRLHPKLAQKLAVVLRDYPAHHQLDVRSAAFLQMLERFARDRQMSAGETAYREHVSVLLQRGFDQLRGCLLEPRQDYLHPGLHTRMGEQLNGVDMPVEARFPERDPNPALRRRHRERSDSRVALENWRRIAAARCTLDRFGPFADRAAGTCQLERRLHHRAALRHCAMQSFARTRDNGLVAPGTPCVKRINALAFNRRMIR